jgi:predicted transposase YdaD
MNSLGYEYQSYFVRRYYGHVNEEGQADGWAEGRAEGRKQMLLALLASRFGPLAEATQARVRGAQDAQLDAVAERIFTAQTLEEAVSQLF